MSVRIEFSLRYAVVGLYVDRGRRIVRIYPVPFVRVSIDTDQKGAA